MPEWFVRFLLWNETWLLTTKWAYTIRFSNLASTNFVLLTFHTGIKLKRNTTPNKCAPKNLFSKELLADHDTKESEEVLT